MGLETILFIQAVRATREDFVEAEQKARSTRIYSFVIVIPALLLSSLFVVSVNGSWETAIWAPAIIVGATFTIAILVLMSTVRHLRYPRQAELEDMRMVRRAIVSTSASIRNAALEGKDGKQSAITGVNASHVTLRSLSVSSDRAFALWLFGRGVTVIFLSIVGTRACSQ